MPRRGFTTPGNRFRGTINRDTTLQLIDVAGFMGMDIFTIDDGWQLEYGENTVDPNAFPGGLDTIRKAVEAKGMRLGLWIPLAAIGAEDRGLRQPSRLGSARSSGKAEDYFHGGWLEGGDVSCKRHSRMRRPTESTMPSSAFTWPM